MEGERGNHFLTQASNYQFLLKYLYRQFTNKYQSIHTVQTGTDAPKYHQFSAYLQTKGATNSLEVCALFPDFGELQLRM